MGFVVDADIITDNSESLDNVDLALMFKGAELHFVWETEW